MTDRTESLRRRIVDLYESHRDQPESVLEAYLEGALGDLSWPDRVAALERLIEDLSRDVGRAAAPSDTSADQEVIRALYRLILGKELPTHLKDPITWDNLSGALNQVFDALNEVIVLMRRVLFGETQELETIRSVMGSAVHARDQRPLFEYVAQIKKGFLMAHEAFVEACESMASKIVENLDPEALARQTEGSLKFGPLRKADLFDRYEKEHAKILKWIESGRCREDFLREFEKACRKKFQSRGG